MVSVIVPIAYVCFLVGSLALFSRIYRRKKTENPATVERWFPTHTSRDVYVSLLSMEPPPPRQVLIAALLRRAMDDVKLIWSIRDEKQTLSVLLQRGQVGDDLWERFLAAEKELEAEIMEVVGEANSFQPGYGQQIFAAAGDMVTHEKWKTIYTDIPQELEKEVARQAQGPAAPVLGSLSYLTPSSLTLSPSNPLPAEGPAAPIAAPIAASVPVAIQAPVAAAPPAALVPPSTPAAGPGSAKLAPPAATPQAVQPPGSPAASVNGATLTPASTPSKPGQSPGGSAAKKASNKKKKGKK